MQSNQNKWQLGLVHRITLAILATLLVVVALVAVSLYVSVERGFSRYVRSLEEARLAPAVRRLNAIYLRDGSWDVLVQQPHRFGMLLGPNENDQPPPPVQDRPPHDRPGQDRRDDHPPPGDKSHLDPLELPPRVTLYDSGGHSLIGQDQFADAASQLPLTSGGVTVGWLGVRAITKYDDDLDRNYMVQVRSHIILIAIAAIALGLLAGWLITRRLLRPIDALTAATRQLAAGDYNVNIAIEHHDELGQLTRDVDLLATILAQNEQSRRQWVADTSHELRTPLTVLRAEIDSMLDGLQPLNHAALESLQAEIARLDMLVADLEQLAQSDRGELGLVCKSINVIEALRESVAAFQTRFTQRNIEVEHNLDAVVVQQIAADRARLQQVFANLLENSLRYTNDGGRLQITTAVVEEHLRLRFDDSAPSVSNDDLVHLFDRFYRADASRSREFGGAGLGLSICQRIVAAHGGTMHAAMSPLGGLRMEVHLRINSIV
jgi:two-component system, OmpR family, sensor histidine kinase BaeS